MEKTWKLTAAGILNIVTAVVCPWIYLALSLEGTLYRSIFPESIFGFNNPATVYLIITMTLFCIGVLTFLGGIFALKKRKWRFIKRSLLILKSVYGAAVVLGFVQATLWNFS